MTTLSRRSVLRSSLAVAAAGTLGAALYRQRRGENRGFVVGAGFRPGRGYLDQEDRRRLREGQRQQDRAQHHAVRAAAPEDRLGGDQRRRPGHVPQQPDRGIALFAWDDKLVDVSDVLATQREEFTETALINMNCYNSVTKKRSFYGVPFTTAVSPNHVWRPLVEKAGYKIEDIPKTWDAYYDFFKDVQKNLRKQGMRNVYGLGLNVTTNGNDPNTVFNYFLTAYGGRDLVTQDGKLHTDDPKVKEAVIKALTYPTTAYKEVFVPPSAINWNDADDNNAFHAKTIVMDLDGTLSTEVAVLSQGKKEDYDNILTMGLALSNDGKPIPSQAANGNLLIPKGAKNVEVAKDFLKYFIQPKVNNELLKTGLGRGMPCMPSIVKDDPWWFADPHRKAYVEQGLLGPTLPQMWVSNPAYAQVQNEHAFMTGWMDIIQHGMAPQAAAEKAFKRVAEIFAKFPIATG